MTGLVVGQIISPAQYYTDFPYFMPNGIPARQREYRVMYIGGVVQVQNLFGYRMQGDNSFHSRFLAVDTDEASAFGCRFNMTGIQLLDVCICKPGQA